jgi:hypothetical protein
MFGIKAAAPATFPAAEWRDRLDALISAAQKAGVGIYEVANHLEAKASALRMVIAVSSLSDCMLHRY